MKTCSEMKDMLLDVAKQCVEVDDYLYKDESNTRWKEWVYSDENISQALIILMHVGNLALFHKSVRENMEPEKSYKLAHDFGLDIYNVFKRHNLVHLFPKK